MKTKIEHIDFWLSQAEYDWAAVETLFNGSNYLQSLFFAHLVLEKVCKALWIKYYESNVPPKTHNLVYLLSTTPVCLTDNQSEFLLNLNRFQLEGRYPEYFTKMNSICNESFTREIIAQAKELKECLQKIVP